MCKERILYFYLCLTWMFMKLQTSRCNGQTQKLIRLRQESCDKVPVVVHQRHLCSNNVGHFCVEFKITETADIQISLNLFIAFVFSSPSFRDDLLSAVRLQSCKQHLLNFCVH